MCLYLFSKCIGIQATVFAYPSSAPYLGIQQRGPVGAENSLHLGNCTHQRDRRVLVRSKMLHAPAAALVGFLVGSSLQAHSLALLPTALTQ